MIERFFDKGEDCVVIADPAKITWIASYPSSGSALLRAILFQVFGVESSTIYRYPEYPAKVGKIIGEVESSRVIKTHQADPPTEGAIIYVYRDYPSVKASCEKRWGGSESAGDHQAHVESYLRSPQLACQITYEELTMMRSWVIQKLAKLFPVPIPDDLNKKLALLKDYHCQSTATS